MKQYGQNHLFQSNQSKFCKELDGQQNTQNLTPNKDEPRKFWFEIWENNVVYSNTAEWISGVETELKRDKEEDIAITAEKVKNEVC